MEIQWGGMVLGFTVGTLFGAVIMGSIWFRHFLRTYKEHYDLLRKSVALGIHNRAVTDVVHGEEIREKRDQIDRTKMMLADSAR